MTHKLAAHVRDLTLRVDALLPRLFTCVFIGCPDRASNSPDLFSHARQANEKQALKIKTPKNSLRNFLGRPGARIVPLGIRPLGNRPPGESSPWESSPWGIVPWGIVPWGITPLGNRPPGESSPWEIVPLGNPRKYS